MASERAVVATFTGLGEAEVARGTLEAEGIEAWLEGEQLVGVAWHLSNATGGVRLVVRAPEAERARNVLQHPDVPEQDAEEETTEEHAADSLATKAWQSALVGFLLAPPLLHVWSVWLLLQSARAGGPRSELARKHAFRAAVTDVIVLTLASFVVARIVASR